MTPIEKAKWLVNDQYYQPLTLHLNVNNNSKEMWDYAKRCALIVVNEVFEVASPSLYKDGRNGMSEYNFWQQVKEEIQKL